jgi:Holliday junction resolvasome RuvABC endonuclease subunit
MIILSLDASTTAVGWMLARDADHLRSGVYRPKGRDAHRRIDAIASWLETMLSAADVGAVFYEQATGNHDNMTTDRLLGAVEHVIVSAARRHGIEPLWVTASQVKASGIHKHVKDTYAEAITGGHLDAKNTGDQKDAIGVWLAGLKKWRESAWLGGRLEGET